MILKQAAHTAEEFAALLRQLYIPGAAFTNGCFDVFHIGHLTGLRQMREECGAIVVGLNSDSSVRKLKGSTRPIFNEDNRAELLQNIVGVQHVVIFDDSTPWQLIDILRPDFCYKGEEYRTKPMPERTLIESYGGEVRYIKTVADVSTTATLSRLGI